MSKSIIKEEIPFQPSTIENIDTALYGWIKDLNLHCDTNEGWKKVDTIWVSAERAYQVKKSRETRETNGAQRYPIITVERTSVVKDPANKGTAYANIPHEADAKGGAASITIARKINHEKTSIFANADTPNKRGQINFPRKNKKIVYETISIPMPVYIDVMYDITIRTMFQQQMNELTQPFMTKTGGINYFIVKSEGHRYESFIQQDFAQNNTVGNLGMEERKYETTVQIKVLGYLIGLGKNQEQPKIVTRENAVEFQFPKERIVVRDKIQHTNKQNFVGTEKTNKS